MRVLKFLSIAALVLLIASPSFGLTIPGGPYKLNVASPGIAGTVYPTIPNSTTVVGEAALNAVGVPGDGAQPGEDTYGILQVSQLVTATIINNPSPPITPGKINGGIGTTVWTSGDGAQELVGFFYGERDQKVSKDASGVQTDQGIALKAYFVLQPVGSANAATVAFLGGGSHVFGDAGSSARLSATKYVGVGVDALGVAIPGATVFATFVSQAGFLGDIPGIEYVSSFDPSGGTSGTARVFASTAPVDTYLGLATVGTANAVMNSNFYQSVKAGELGLTADIDFQIQTTAVLGPKPGQPAFNWEATGNNGTIDDINAIPEPITMIGLLMSVLGVGGYIKRRRAVA